MLILGSGSARRKELMESVNIDFQIVVGNFDEDSITNDGDIKTYVESIAEHKAKAILKKHLNHVILSADTIVEIDGEILGKPKDDMAAVKMLEKLNGQTHNVYTGVCIISKEKMETFVDYARVTFNQMSSLDIQNYVNTKEPLDKAGAYAIQGIGAKFIKEYHGDFHTIMGLPLKAVLRKLESFGIYQKFF